MPILHCYLLDLQYGHTHQDLGHALYGIYPYVHALDWFIFVFFMIMMGQPICNKDFRPCFVEDFAPSIDELLALFAVSIVTELLHLF